MAQTTSSRVLVQRSPLPLEVLNRIFLLILPSDLELDEEWRLPFSQRLQGSGLLLCAVCALWRTLALATPQLWRQILIHIPQGISKAIACSKADNLLQQIQRSTLPLALYISSEGFFGQARARVPSIISVLQRHATRCRALYLQNPSDNLLVEIFKSEQIVRSPLRRGVRTMPQENQLFSWAQLTHLQIRRCISPQHALVIFNACSKLAWLSINLKLPPRPAYVDDSEPPIILHDLASIFLGSDTACLSLVMPLISAPSLREMCVASTWTTTRDSQSLVHFLTRSSCTLDRLELGGNFVDYDIIPVLAHESSSSLTSLVIRDFPDQDRDFFPLVNDEILRRLTLHRDDSLCPHLNLLGLRGITGSQSVVQSMIESRKFPQADRLQHFHLQWDNVLEFDLKQLDEVLERSEMAYSLDSDSRNSSASGWPQGETYSQDIYCTGLRNW